MPPPRVPLAFERGKADDPFVKDRSAVEADADAVQATARSSLLATLHLAMHRRGAQWPDTLDELARGERLDHERALGLRVTGLARALRCGTLAQ